MDLQIKIVLIIHKHLDVNNVKKRVIYIIDLILIGCSIGAMVNKWNSGKDDYDLFLHIIYV